VNPAADGWRTQRTPPALGGPSLLFCSFHRTANQRAGAALPYQGVREIEEANPQIKCPSHHGLPFIVADSNLRGWRTLLRFSKGCAYDARRRSDLPSKHDAETRLKTKSKTIRSSTRSRCRDACLVYVQTNKLNVTHEGAPFLSSTVL